jgi:hypothetical protein
MKIRMFSFWHDTKWSCGWRPIAQLHAGAVRWLFLLPGTKREHMFDAAVQRRSCVLVWKNGKRACGAADAH